MYVRDPWNLQQFTSCHENYEKTAAQALYASVRAGKLDEVIDSTKKLSNHGELQRSGFNGEAFVRTSALSAKFEPHMF